MKIILTGGGSAGHVTPNLALIPHLKKHFNEIEYIGSKNGIEKDIVINTQIPYHEITTCKLNRSLTIKNLTLPFKLIKGISEAKKILQNLKPNIVFSKGGFVSVPVVIAAHKLKIPIIAHESDFSLGLANKIIYHFCKKMCFTFDNIPKKYLKKSIVTGPPIRKEIISKEKLSFNNNKKTILVIGGSLGAKSINDFIFSNIKELTKSYNLIHIVGKNNINQKFTKITNYKQIDYTNNIGKLYNSCDLSISRAGSNTIFELLALKIPMILIPLPKDSSRGDQIENANYFEKNNYADVIKQDSLNINLLLNTIKSRLNKKIATPLIKPLIANEKILKEIISSVNLP